MDEWRQWSGGRMPVSAATVVEVRLRGGEVDNILPAERFDWTHFGEDVEDGDSDIVAYRIVSRKS